MKHIKSFLICLTLTAMAISVMQHLIYPMTSEGQKEATKILSSGASCYNGILYDKGLPTNFKCKVEVIHN